MSNQQTQQESQTPMSVSAGKAELSETELANVSGGQQQVAASGRTPSAIVGQLGTPVRVFCDGSV